MKVFSACSCFNCYHNLSFRVAREVFWSIVRRHLELNCFDVLLLGFRLDVEIWCRWWPKTWSAQFNEVRFEGDLSSWVVFSFRSHARRSFPFDGPWQSHTYFSIPQTMSSFDEVAWKSSHSQLEALSFASKSFKPCLLTLLPFCTWCEG